MNAKYTLYRAGKKLISIEVFYPSMGIILCFRFKNPKNYWKTLKPEIQEELEWLLYHASLECVKLPSDPSYEYWDPWRPPRREEDTSNYWVAWGTSDSSREKVFDIELNQEFLEYIRDQEDDRFKYRLDQSIQRYKNCILGRGGKGPKYRSNQKREDPFKYQKYRYVKK